MIVQGRRVRRDYSVAGRHSTCRRRGHGMHFHAQLKRIVSSESTRSGTCLWKFLALHASDEGRCLASRGRGRSKDAARPAHPDFFGRPAGQARLCWSGTPQSHTGTSTEPVKQKGRDLSRPSAVWPAGDLMRRERRKGIPARPMMGLPGQAALAFWLTELSASLLRSPSVFFSSFSVASRSVTASV